MLCEVLIQSLFLEADNAFTNYFGFKNGRGICNGVLFNNVIAISAVGFNQLFDWSSQVSYEGFSKVKVSKKIQEVKFYHNKQPLTPICVLMINEVEKWLKEMDMYFETIDNFFKLTKERVIEMTSSIIILQMMKCNELPYGKGIHSIPIGLEIYSINSNLSFISYQHFSHSFSKGIISNRITDHIYFIDIRGIPNSLLSVIYDAETNTPLLTVITVLNIAKSYSPLIFGFSLARLEELIGQAVHPHTSSSSLCLDKPYHHIKHIQSNQPLLEAIFMLHDNHQSATCFHIGNGILITAKHFFNENNTNNSHYTITNQFHTFQCNKYFLPENSFDIALLKIDCSYHQLPFIKIDSSVNAIAPMTPFYSYQYSLFPKDSFLSNGKKPNQTKGCISKVIRFEGKDCLYQLDSCCYNGASGSPLISRVVYQNISLNKVQLPYLSFAFSRDLLNDIYLNKDDVGQLKKLWFMSISSEKLNDVLFLSLFKAKL